ncbi:MAG: TIGR03936 family radical SAM-associated protein [Thermoleophilia bacterium]|nr:TIGR03936 family radical SAM-associated protein [Thermoleophilia bacterium]
MRTWLVGFARRGPARYLSHLDTLRAVQRTFARAGVELELSEGMRPKPRLSLPLPLPVGATADDELAVARVTEAAPGARDGLAALKAAAPEGLDVIALQESPGRVRPQPLRARYACEVRGEADAVIAAVEAFEKDPPPRVVRRGPKGTKTVDLRRSVGAVTCRATAGGAHLEFEVRYDVGTAARPQEVIEVIADKAGIEPVLHRLRRVEVVFAEAARVQRAPTQRSART